MTWWPIVAWLVVSAALYPLVKKSEVPAKWESGLGPGVI